MTVLFVPVTGFLGAGKTTTIGALASSSRAGARRW
jgi:G3E family GTPase